MYHILRTLRSLWWYDTLNCRNLSIQAWTLIAGRTPSYTINKCIYMYMRQYLFIGVVPTVSGNTTYTTISPITLPYTAWAVERP